MAYAQIHTQALRHHKVAALSDAAFRLWVTGLAHCQELLTDGVIASSSLRSIAGKVPQKLLQELETNRLWEPIENGYRVHDYLEWNDSKEQIAHRRERWKQKKAGNPPLVPPGKLPQVPPLDSPGKPLQIVPTETLRDVKKETKPSVSTGPPKDLRSVWDGWRLLFHRHVGIELELDPKGKNPDYLRSLFDMPQSPARILACAELLLTSKHFDTKRHFGMLVSNLAQLDAWLRDHPGVPFGENLDSFGSRPMGGRAPIPSAEETRNREAAMARGEGL